MSPNIVRVLLVEDDEDDYVLVRDLLEQISVMQAELRWVRTAEQAVTSLCDGSVDVCLLDYRLGASDGLDLLRQVRAGDCNTPVIILTGQSDYEVDMAAMQAGAADFLAKNSVTPALLERSIRYAIQQRRVNEQRLKLDVERAARRQLEQAQRTLFQSEMKLRALNETLEQRVAERTAVAEQRAAQLTALAAELTQAEQRERRRLSQILHDHLQQLIVAAKMKLAAARMMDGEELRQTVSKVEAMLGETVQMARTLTVELSPPVLYDAGLAAALQWLARHWQAKHGLNVEVAADPVAEPEAEAMRVLLFVATRELLFNVIKHSGADSASVTLRRQGDLAVLTVEDRGVGFDGACMEEVGGSDGFGLFSVRERLQLVGGDMRIDAARGRGCRVTVSVPITAAVGAEVKEQLPEAVPSNGRPQAAPRPARRDDRIRVLVVDDQKILREGLGSLLAEHEDLQVIGEAGDGVAAIEAVGRVEPDVVIMDISMPRMNGIEATRRIAAAHPQVSVIGLSMHEHEDMAAAMRQAGAAAYLVKDGPSEALIAAIRACGVASRVAPTSR